MILALVPVTVSAEPAEPLANATGPAARGFAELNDQDLLGLFNKSMAGGLADNCEMAAMLSEMARRRFADGVAEFRIEYLVQCAIERQDWPNAYGYIKQWEELGSDNPPAMEWAFRLAYIAGQYDEALDRLEIMAKLDDPEQLMALSDRMLFNLARQFNEDGEIRQYQMLFQSLHFELLSIEMRSMSASWMLKQKLRNKDIGDVGDLLTKITSPYYYAEMLADRTFEPIWPQIEQHVGPNMANILNPYLKEMKDEFESDPENMRQKQIYGHALLFSGRFEDIIALAETIDRSDAAIQNWDEDDGWLLNLEAYAEDALGNATAADRVFDQFGQIDYHPKENSWLVNFVINRASRLVGQKRWEEGLDAAQTAGKVSEKSGSPYANMLVRWSKLCALHGLGRSEEAETILSEIDKNQDDSLLIAAQAMLCIGEPERAAKLVIKGLEGDNTRDVFIEILQKPAFKLFYADSSLPGVYEELRHHPDVAKLFDRLARDIPDEFIPLVGVRRQELAAEREAD